LGNATGDGNTWCQWLVWAFGGKLVDQNNKVVIDSPETVKALEYAKALYATFVPGTLSWLDPNNNKAFLDGQLSLTNNGISIYYATKNATDPKVKEMSADINHANMPIGPIGRPTEFQLFFNQLIFKYTKYPKAAEGVHSLHDGRRANESLGTGGDRLCHAGAAGLPEASDLDVGSETHALSRFDEEHAAERLCRENGLRIGRRARRLHRRQHGCGGRLGIEDAEGSRGTRAKTRRALLQNLERHPGNSPHP
jgi:hypothetical protein